MKELKNDIKKNSFKRVYLFYGPEAYLSVHYEGQIKQTLIAPGSEIMNYDVFDGKTVTANAIADACATMPFLNDRRLVVVRDSQLFTTGRKDETEKMCAYLDEVSDTTVLLFAEEAVDKRNKLYKKVHSLYKTVEFKTPTDSELVRWVVQICRRDGKSISSADAAYFVKTVTHNMDAIKGELEKLVSYKAEEDEIHAADIDAVCTKSLEARVFDLVAAVANKRPAQALEIYSQLISVKESPIMILAMIGRQFRIILKSRLLFEEGMQPVQIADALSLRSYVVGDCLKQSRSFQLETLYQAIEDCLDTDIRIKTGQITDKLAVEALIVKLGSTSAAPPPGITLLPLS